MITLAVLFGLLVGLVLGLIGGGGSVLAIPLLVHGLGLSPHDAVAISLAAVGSTAAVGCVARLRSGAMELNVGLLFAAAGILGTPAGVWLHHQLSERVVMLLFALLMLAIAAQMWWRNRAPLPEGERVQPQRSAVMVLLSAGLLVGVLSGLLGVGGGILIVPALLLATPLSFHKAASTALLVIAIVSAAGVVSHYLGGHPPDPPLTLAFIGGGLAGMFVGLRLANRVSGLVLQRIFALLLAVVAVFELLSWVH